MSFIRWPWQSPEEPKEPAVMGRPLTDADLNAVREELHGEVRAVLDRAVAVSRGLERLQSNERLIEQLTLRVEHLAKLCEDDRTDFVGLSKALKLEHSEIRLELARLKEPVKAGR